MIAWLKRRWNNWGRTTIILNGQDVSDDPEAQRIVSEAFKEADKAFAEAGKAFSTVGRAFDMLARDLAKKKTK